MTKQTLCIMRNFYLLILCFCFLNIMNGQTTKTVIKLIKLDIGSQGAGLSYEPKVFNNFTIDLCAGVGGGYDIDKSEFTYAVLKPALYLSLTPKYFYNIQRRISKGKNTQLNSANYFGIRVKYVTPFAPQIDPEDPISTNAVLTNIHWGIQRAIGGHWLFNSQIGVGYGADIDCNCGMIYPAFDFKFAYIILKSRK
jgi:hypothetical protein